ncbi:P2Y purinoceptor 13-like [Engraulis encrasicolus]|uniref:P2Y purinoceptor 13-like n=1 Tax=Engraulis encrasicolus TaxID=184585 RepID=UPI002FD20B65
MDPVLLHCGIDLHVANIVIIGFYFVLFIPALLLNIMAAWISWNLKTKSSFIVYLKNLVAADLLMTLLAALRAADWIPGMPWGFRAYNCRFGSVLFYLCMYVSIVLMGVISLDRFFKIVQPGGKMFGQSPLFGKVVTIVIWILYIIQTIPTMVLTNKKPTNYTCMNMKTDLGRQYHKGIIIFSNVVFFVVLTVIGFCYICIAKRVIESHRNAGNVNINGKRKIKARVFIVLVVFLVCFAPYHITSLLYVERQVKNKINCSWASLKIAKDITLWLATTNVCLDPLVYILLCKDFRKKFYELKIFRNRFYTTSTGNTVAFQQNTGQQSIDL